MSAIPYENSAGSRIFKQFGYIFIDVDYRYKCIEKAETDRLLSSRLSLLNSSYSKTRSNNERQMDDTNRRYYKKVLILLANLIHICLQSVITSPQYSVDLIKPFYLDFMDLNVVGIA